MSRPWASRLVVAVPLVLDVPVVLPCASRKVVFSVFDCEAVPVVLPWASLKVVVVPDVLVVVEDLSVAFLPARVEAGSAKARMGNRRTRISFMDDIGLEIFTSPPSQPGGPNISPPKTQKPAQNYQAGLRQRSLCVLNKLPGDGLLIIGRHFVAFSDWGRSGRTAQRLPYSAFGAGFAGLSCGSEWNASRGVHFVCSIWFGSLGCFTRDLSRPNRKRIRGSLWDHSMTLKSGCCKWSHKAP